MGPQKMGSCLSASSLEPRGMLKAADLLPAGDPRTSQSPPLPTFSMVLLEILTPAGGASGPLFTSPWHLQRLVTAITDLHVVECNHILILGKREDCTVCGCPLPAPDPEPGLSTLRAILEYPVVIPASVEPPTQCG